MNKGSIVERLCSDLDRKEPRYKCATFYFLLTCKLRRRYDIYFTHGHCGLVIIRERFHVAVREEHVKHVCNVILKHEYATVT